MENVVFSKTQTILYKMDLSQIFLNQPTGLYIVLIETGNVSSVQKVVLEK